MKVDLSKLEEILKEKELEAEIEGLIKKCIQFRKENPEKTPLLIWDSLLYSESWKLLCYIHSDYYQRFLALFQKVRKEMENHTNGLV